MTDQPSAPPTEIRAGDSARWRRTLADHPASAGWELKYVLVGNAVAHSFAAAAAGDDHAVDLLSAATAAWAPGSYRLQEYVELAGERTTLSVTTLRVLPNLVAATSGLDTRTHARKVLDLIEAWLESKAPTAAAFELNGRKLQNYPIPDLLVLRDRYRAEVRREDAAALGAGAGRILVRF